MTQATIENPSKSEPEAPRTGGSGRVHLGALDGMRGLAALYVVIHHAFLIYAVETKMVTPNGEGMVARLGRALDFPELAVGLFIVLSGYCLMAPVAVRGPGAGWSLGSFGGYVARRARRILPPYYAALGLSLLAIWLLPQLSVGETAWWGPKFWGNFALPAFKSDVLVTHLLMIFNWRGDWIFRINSPFWSVATEWQIYFLFPLLFLPLLRLGGRWGLMLLAPLAFLAGFVPYALLRRGAWSIADAHPWYTGLFAMGMTAAVASLSPALDGIGKWLKKWGGTVALLGLAAVAGIACFTTWRQEKYGFVFDAACGVLTMGWLIFLTRGWLDVASDSAAARMCRAVFGSRPLKKLGDMSYSLYLTHAPVLIFVHHWSAQAGWHTSAPRVLAIMFLIATPLSIVLAAGFHLVFERPFMSSRKLTPGAAEGVAA